jgi:glycosyltransferase involved in cell wall biosynthesis
MSVIRAFIHYETTDRPWGGSNSFLYALKTYLSGVPAVEIVPGPDDDFDVMLLNTAYTGPGRYTSLRQIRMFDRFGYPGLINYAFRGFKKRPIKIVLRLDGLRRFYADMPEVRGDGIQLQLTRHADAIIFQSNESLNQFRKTLGTISVPHVIIHNGVNQNIFNLQGKTFWNKKDPLRIFTTSWSKNLRKGFADIVRLSRENGVTVNFAGNWPAGFNPEGININPPMPQKLLAEEYKKNDVFFFPSQNEACPNVVYEALSCGLPVIYHPSGGTPEAASGYGVELSDDITASLHAVSDRYDSYVSKIQNDQHLFSIDYAGNKYVEVFQSVFRR